MNNLAHDWYLACFLCIFYCLYCFFQSEQAVEATESQIENARQLWEHADQLLVQKENLLHEAQEAAKVLEKRKATENEKILERVIKNVAKSSLEACKRPRLEWVAANLLHVYVWKLGVLVNW